MGEGPVEGGGAVSSLVVATKLGELEEGRWVVGLYPEAAEAGGTEKTAQEQGLPICVEDSSVISEIAILLTSGRAPFPSRSPDRLDTVGIEAVPAPDGRIDDDPGEDGTDDGPLPGRVEVRPLRPEGPRVADEPVERRGA